MQLEFLDKNGTTTLSAVGSLDDQSFSVSGKYLIESNQSWGLEGIISTPFKGYDKFRAMLSLDNRDLEKDYHFNVETPLEMIPLLDVTLLTVNLPAPNLEMLFFGSVVGEPFGVNATFLRTDESYAVKLSTLAMAQSATINASFSLTNQSYAVVVDLETSFVEQLEFARLHSGVLLDGWNKVEASASVAIPSGSYSIDGMYTLDETSFHFNGSIHSASLKPFFQVGASYLTGENHIEAQIFVGENEIDARYLAREGGENASGELNVDLPDAPFDPIRLSFQVIDPPYSQLQVTMTANVESENHTLIINNRFVEADSATGHNLEVSFFSSFSICYIQ